MKDFVPYELALELKQLGFDEPCFGWYNYGTLCIFGNDILLDGYAGDENRPVVPTFSQAINFLYICSNKQIDIELKASDTYEERVRKVAQGCEDLRNLQNNKSN